MWSAQTIAEAAQLALGRVGEVVLAAQGVGAAGLVALGVEPIASRVFTLTPNIVDGAPGKLPGAIVGVLHQAPVAELCGEAVENIEISIESDPLVPFTAAILLVREKLAMRQMSSQRPVEQCLAQSNNCH